MNEQIVVEIDNNGNQSALFPPAGKVVRGRCDFRRIRDCAQPALLDWNIPGQQIILDVAGGQGAIEDLIHRDPKLIDKLKKKNWEPGPVRESMKAHVPTWQFWMRRIVDSGIGKLVSGDLPLTSDIRGARTDFFSTPHVDPKEDRVDKLIAILLATLPEKARKEAQSIMAVSI